MTHERSAVLLRLLACLAALAAVFVLAFGIGRLVDPIGATPDAPVQTPGGERGEQHPH